MAGRCHGAVVDYLLYTVTGSDQLSGHQRLWTRHTRAAPTCRTHLRPRFEVYQTFCGLVHLFSCLPCSFYAHLLALLWSLVATDRSHCRRWGARWYRERRRGLVCGSKGNVSARQQTLSAQRPVSAHAIAQTWHNTSTASQNAFLRTGLTSRRQFYGNRGRLCSSCWRSFSVCPPSPVLSCSCVAAQDVDMTTSQA